MGYLYVQTTIPLTMIITMLVLSGLFFLSAVLEKNIKEKLEKKTGPKLNGRGIIDDTIQSFLNCLDYPVFAVDKKYRYIFFNRHHADEVKKKHSAEIKTGESIFIHIKNKNAEEIAKSYLNRSLKGETFKALTHSFPIGTPDNKYQSVYHSPLFNSKGKIEGVTVIAYDITDLVNMSNSLQDSEDKFRLISEHSTDLIFIINDRGVLEYMSPAVKNLQGFEPESIIGKPFSDYFEGKELSVAVESFRKVLNGETVKDIELDMPGAFGRPVTLLTNLSPLKGTSGDLHVLGISRDITELKKAIQKKEETEKIFRQTLENIELLAVIIDSKGIITFVNDYAIRLTGYTREELIGNYVFGNILNSDGKEEIERFFFSQFTSKKVSGPSYIFPINTKTGGTRIIKWNSTLINDINGNCICVNTIGEDVTDSIDREHKLIETNEKLKLLYEISGELSKTLDVNNIYQIVHNLVRKSIPCDEFLVSSYNEETENVKCVALWGMGTWINPDNLPELQLTKDSKGNQNAVIRSGKPRIVNNLTKEITAGKTTYYFNENGEEVENVPGDIPVCNSGIFVPLKIDNKVIGVLQIFSYRINAFDKSHLDLLETISMHISYALANAKLYRQANEEITFRKKAQIELEQSQKIIIDSNARLKLLYDTSKKLSTTLDPHTLHRIFYDAIVNTMPCEGYLVSIYDNENKMIMCSAANAGGLWLFSGSLPDIPLDEGGTGAQSRVILTGKPLIVKDLDKYQEHVKHRQYISDRGDVVNKCPEKEIRSRSGIYVPLKINNKVAGVVTVQSSEINAYTGEHLRLLETLSIHLSSSLANAELYKRAQDEIAERKKIEETLQLTQFSVEKATDAIIWVDMSGQFSEVNEEACNLFETDKNEFLKKYVWEYELKATQNSWGEFKKRIKNSGSELGETEIQTGSGKIIPVEMLSNYLFFKEKEYIVGFVRDISRRKHTEELLRASEEKYRAIFEQTSLGVCLVTLPPSLKFVKVNKAYSEMVGYSEEELLKFSVLDITFTDNDEIRYREIFESANHFQLEQRHLKKNGDIIWVKVAVTIIRDNNGIPLYGLAIVSDISSQKLTEDMLKSSEDRYRSVISALSEGVVLYDTNGKVMTCNESAYKILGLNKKDFNERNLTDNSWRTIRENGRSFKADEYPSSISLKTGKHITDVVMGVYKPDGELRWIIINAVPLFKNNSNTPYAAVTSYTDITAQKRAGEALRESEERYRGIFEQTNIGISILTIKEWKYLKVNKAYCDMLGYSEDELMNLTIEDISHPDDYLKQIQTGQFDNNSDFVMEKRLKKKNGEYIWINVSSSIIRDNNNNPVFRQAIIENIDLQKKAELELQFQDEKLRSLYYLSNRPFTDENEILKFALEEIVRLTKSKLGFLHMISENELDIDETFWSASVYKYFNLNTKYNFRIDSIEAWAECTRKRRPVINNNIQVDNAFQMPEGHPGIFNLLSVPVYEEGSLKLIVGIGNKNEDYDDNDALQVQLFSEETWRIITKNRKEKQLEKSLKEKEIMLKEIHHRVKNNLQIISALLNLKSLSVENPETQSILIESRDRVQSMALVHKKLYSSDDFSGINFGSYLQDLSYMLLTNSSPEAEVNIVYDIDNFEFDVNFMVPVGLIFNEMLTNSFKHAFRGRDTGEIKISAHKNDENNIVIKYSDNGTGFEESFDPSAATSLGLQLIYSLADQIQGSLKVTNINGVNYEITIKEN